MASELSVDTSFLIDLQRERRIDGPRPAHSFLQQHLSGRFAVSAVALGEFAEGFANPQSDHLHFVIDSFAILPIECEVALVYSRIARELRARGALIGTNDLWIAATALHHDLPVVTADGGFRAVEGLKLEVYR